MAHDPELDSIKARLAAAEARVTALHDSELKFRSLFETMGQGYVEAEIVRDAQGRPVDCRLIELNPAFERLTGVSAEAARGRTNRELFPGIDDWWPRTADRIQRSGLPERVEHWVAPLDRSYAVYFYPGAGDRFTALYEDITEQKRGETALRESEARLAAAFESVPAGVAVIDMSGRVVLANAEYRRFLPSGIIPSRDPERGGRWRAWDGAGQPIEPTNYPGARAMRGERVVPGQEMLYRDDEDREIWTRVAAVPIRDANGTVTGQSSVISDIDALKRSAEILREGESRQAFLLRLSDALRPIVDPSAIMAAASAELGQHLRVGRCGYGEVDDAGEYWVIASDWTDGLMPSMAGTYALESFGEAYMSAYRAGETVSVPDIPADLRSRGLKISLGEVGGVQATLAVPLLKQGMLRSIFYAQQLTPRPWSTAEEQLVRDVSERTWDAVERARAEARLRTSEERFRQFAKASAAGLWIRDAETLAMEFVSPVIGDLYGVGRDALLGDVRRWVAAIVPEDRASALEHLRAARDGKVAVHEFRIQRASDRAFRWIRNTDFPLHDDGHIGRIGGIAEDITETRQLTEHQSVLLAELQHRVRNIMGMIRSMANRTASGVAGVQDYRSLLEGRLLALARVQALLTQQANAGGSLRAIIASEIAAQAHDAHQFTLRGPEIELAPKSVEVLTLAFHELATNALKYGALSTPDGRLTVSWTPMERRGAPWLTIDWIEEGTPAHAPSTRRGFGSELIEARIPYELGGRGKLTLGPEGARCHLAFPLRQRESILETDAPQPVTIFGGTLDMSGAADLTGRTILVVEDDYYMANDTAAALRGVGAEVLGPCPSFEATRELLEDELPTHAVLDLNLGGGGPQFEIAHLLKDCGVPFVFLTGYDPEVIPPDMADVVRLQKPVPFRAIVEAISQL